MGAGGCEQYRKLFEQYDWPVETALAICQMESSGVATASNWKDSHDGCNGSFGLMQTACLYTTEHITREDLYDPATNIRIAYEVYKRQGWDAWRNSYAKLLTVR